MPKKILQLVMIAVLALCAMPIIASARYWHHPLTWNNKLHKPAVCFTDLSPTAKPAQIFHRKPICWKVYDYHAPSEPVALTHLDTTSTTRTVIVIAAWSLLALLLLRLAIVFRRDHKLKHAENENVLEGSR